MLQQASSKVPHGETCPPCMSTLHASPAGVCCTSRAHLLVFASHAAQLHDLTAVEHMGIEHPYSLEPSPLLPPEHVVNFLKAKCPEVVLAHRWDPHVRRSRVGQKLSDLTSQRVIVLILTMLIMIPGFNWNSGLYGGYDSIFGGGLSMLHDGYLANGNTTGFQLVNAHAISSPAILTSIISEKYSAGSSVKRFCKAHIRRISLPLKTYGTPGVCMQQVADYVRDEIFPLVNRNTGFMLILIVCNNTIGYPGGPERGYWLRTPEFSVTR